MSRANNINPAMLAWAREGAGLEVEEAAARLGFMKTTEKASAARRLMALENGERAPTRTQLLELARVYRCPLLSFYLKRPPGRGDRGEDFRRSAGAISRRESSLLDALLRDVRARQEMIRSLLEDEEESHELAFVGSASIDDGARAVAASIASTLGFDHRRREERRGDAGALFMTLRECAESAGVFVLLVGDLGSYHTALGVEVFRGFAISDRVAPFVAINDRDARSARSFTLIHELAHLWLDRPGVSGLPFPDAPRSPEDRIEQFCNDVAGEFLLPAEGLDAEPAGLDARDEQGAAEAIRVLAKAWSVSEPMVAYRLKRTGRIATEVYRNLMSGYAARWQEQRKRERERNRERDGAPSAHVIRRSRLGRALLDVVRRTLRDNMLTHTKAAKLLGVKPGAVEPLLRGS